VPAAAPPDVPRLLVARGADRLEHPGGTLGAHLRRVADRLAGHGVDDRTRVTGLYHAAYGTDGFPHALLRLDERPVLAAEIGDDAEAQVLLYCSCDRAQTYPQLADPIVTFVDRFTGAAAGVPREGLRTFAAVTIANELDVAEHLDLGAAARAELRVTLAPLADLVTPAARGDLDHTLA
jgi:uncharacterized protein DUF6817